MKKIFLSAAMLLAFGASVKAQDINFGVKAGVNLANLTGDVPDEVKGRTGFHAGVIAGFKITENFAIQPELLYSQQGATFDGTEDGVAFESTWKLDYLNLPIAAKYTVFDGFSILAGPQIGYRLNAEIDVEVPGYGSDSMNIKDTTNDIDFSIIGGLEYDLPMGVFFQARYNAGITKLNNDDVDTVKNGVLQFSVGFRF